ncbi:hypothetical protein [Paenibacillus campi]|uniref:hypothetical protein n=1 Tax=Paenibacillus campi TaxID=3106031 RepID=UPI002AFEB7C7|nr:MULTISPECIES: hypothetical protein [unclassified Paenibacillus]
MNNRNQGVWIVLLIVAGIVILLGKLGVFAFLGRAFWPLLILLPGVVLQLAYFSRSISSYWLIPAGMLTVYGVLFFLCNTWGWGLLDVLWPLFIGGVALGLYEYYTLSPVRIDRRIGLGSILLGALTIGLLLITLLGAALLYVIAIALIAAALWLFLGQNKSGRMRK